MKKILFSLISVFLLLGGGMWFLRHPGHIVIQWLGYEVELAFSTFVIVLVGGIFLLWITVSLLFWILKLPFRLGDRYALYNRQKGFEALYGALEAQTFQDSERFEKEAEQVDILLKEKELSLYLKGKAALLQKDYPLSEQYFYELSQTKKGQVNGLAGLLESAQAQKASDQRWRLVQQLSEVAMPSRYLQITFFESALEQGEHDAALKALKPLLRNRLASEKEIFSLKAKAYLAKEASLAQAKDVEGAAAAAEEAFDAHATPETLKRYLPYLLKADKERKARKLLTRILTQDFDQGLFTSLMMLEGKKAPLDQYDFMKSFYDKQKWQPDLVMALVQLALESELWGDTKSLLDFYQKEYGEDKDCLCQKAALCLAESVDFKKAISFYQQAFKG